MAAIEFPGTPFTLAEAASLGLSRTRVDRLVRDGVLQRERHGLYVDAEAFRQMDPLARHRAVARRIAELLHGEFAFGRHTAAAFHRLATPASWNDQPKPVCVYALDNQNSHVAKGLHIYATSILVSDVVDVDDVRATSLARTALDLARGQRLPYALVPLDSALRLGSTMAQLARQAERMYRWPGTKGLKFALAMADGRSESALESISRGVFAEMRLRPPQLQCWVSGESQRRYRADFLWREQRVIGEADGWGKNGSTPQEWQQSLKEAKAREEDLEAAGFTVVRWSFETLQQRARTLARLVGQIPAP